jgi:prostaglandin-endoperoxide synthase 2
MPVRGDVTKEIAGYTSWESLTDQQWFGRHLPPRDLPIQPNVVGLFEIGSGGPTLSGHSSLLFPSFAEWFTDGFLMTDMKETRRTMSCHHIDLNPLYGLTREQTQALRLQSEDVGKKGFLKFDLINDEVYAPKLFDGNQQVKQEFKLLRPPLRLDIRKSIWQRAALHFSYTAFSRFTA